MNDPARTGPSAPEGRVEHPDGVGRPDDYDRTLDVPSWFSHAISVPAVESTDDVDGCGIHWMAWGEPGRPGLVFVHGGAAHLHWWSPIIPLLADDYRVVALDMSGHGDSGRREDYTLERWTSEVVAVSRLAECDGPPVVIGHSMGGFVAIAAAAHHGPELAGAIILDSPVSRPDPELEAARSGTLFANTRVYDEREVAISRYRTVPEQQNYVPVVKDHVARHSLRSVDEGWVWKFDPDIFVPRRSQARELLGEVRCRVAVFRAEHGLVTEDIGAYMYDLLGRVAPVVEIPLAGHHLMLDQPLLLLVALRTLLADWEHSIPTRR